MATIGERRALDAMPRQKEVSSRAWTALAVIGIAGCTACPDAKNPAEEKDAPPPELEEVTGLAEKTNEDLIDTALDELLRPAAELETRGAAGWEYALAERADLDGDGFQEQLWVLAQVTLADDGQPLWEDGQEWQVYVEDEDGITTHLFAGLVQLGRLDVSITHMPQPTILVQTTSYSSARTYEFVYNGPRKVEARTLVARDIMRRPNSIHAKKLSSSTSSPRTPTAAPDSTASESTTPDTSAPDSPAHRADLPSR